MQPSPQRRSFAAMVGDEIVDFAFDLRRRVGVPKTSMVHAGQELNDHRLIRYRKEGGHYSRFMPWHAAAEHRLCQPGRIRTMD